MATITYAMAPTKQDESLHTAVAINDTMSVREMLTQHSKHMVAAAH